MNEYFLEIATRERQAALLAEAVASRMRPNKRRARVRVGHVLLTTTADLARSASTWLYRLAENLDCSLGRGCCVDPEV